MAEGFFLIPRSLMEDPLWKKASFSDQAMYLVLLTNVCYKEQKFDDYGEVLTIQPGELCCSQQEFAELCGHETTKKQVENFFKRFALYQFLGLRLGRRRSIISITHKDTYDLLKNNFGATDGTISGRSRGDIKRTREQGNNISSSKDSDIKRVTAPALKNSKIFFMDRVSLSQEQHETLVAQHGEELAKKFYEELNNYKHSTGKKYTSDYHTILNWVVEKVLKKNLTQSFLEGKKKSHLNSAGCGTDYQRMQETQGF